MQRQLPLICVLLLLEIGCSQEPKLTPINESKVTFLGIEQCCFNLEISSEGSSNPKEEPYNNMLAAVNIDDYIDALSLKAGDSLTINYVFTDQIEVCTMFCNRPNGIPIQLMAAKKH